jgi:hypothetical protein
MIVSV